MCTYTYMYICHVTFITRIWRECVIQRDNMRYTREISVDVYVWYIRVRLASSCMCTMNMFINHKYTQDACVCTYIYIYICICVCKNLHSRYFWLLCVYVNSLYIWRTIRDDHYTRDMYRCIYMHIYGYDLHRMLHMCFLWIILNWKVWVKFRRVHRFTKWINKDRCICIHTSIYIHIYTITNICTHTYMHKPIPTCVG